MKTNFQSEQAAGISRREFITTSTVAALASPLAGGIALGQERTGSLLVGLVGCGGRGTGAAAQALAADPNVKIMAMGDVFKERLEQSHEALMKEAAEKKDRIDVPEERRYVGFDVYQKVIASGVDVVLLATPPHFRPMHLKAAIEAGKHVFAEKPVAVDAPGVRSVLATCEEARRKKLSIVSGLALRYSNGYGETVRRIHAGEIGEIRGLQANDFRGPIWVKKRKPEWTDMEYQMHNWYYFTWLSGDFNVEQHIHMLDTCAWIMKDHYPISAIGLGGRQVRTGEEYGNIYDHHSVIYEYANGVKLNAQCRQQAGGHNDIAAEVVGSKGFARISQRGMEIRTGSRWKYEGEENNHFVTEHEVLFKSIREGKPVNNGEYMAKSTMMAILGRMASYTGQKITWEQAMNSKEDLSPNRYDWDATPPKSEIAMPGLTKFI